MSFLLCDRRKILRAIRAAALKSRTARIQGPATLMVPPNAGQLSVMFIDLVGSTELSARLDPEDFAEVIGAYHRICASSVTKFGGSLAKYVGDGVLAYFGYPEAHEEDAERAVRAGSFTSLMPFLQSICAPESDPRSASASRTGLVVVGELIGEGSAPGTIGGRRHVESRGQTSGCRFAQLPWLLAEVYFPPSCGPLLLAMRRPRTPLLN